MHIPNCTVRVMGGINIWGRGHNHSDITQSPECSTWNCEDVGSRISRLDRKWCPTFNLADHSLQWRSWQRSCHCLSQSFPPSWWHPCPPQHFQKQRVCHQACAHTQDNVRGKTTKWKNEEIKRIEMTSKRHAYHSVLAVQMKNWEPLVLGPAFAMDKIPGPVCFRVKFSSANLLP